MLFYFYQDERNKVQLWKQWRLWEKKKKTYSKLVERLQTEFAVASYLVKHPE